jgi:two-component system response regulator HydG
MSQTAFILILTEDVERGERWGAALRDRYGHACNVVASIEEALHSVRARTPDVVVADLRGNGAAACSELAGLLDTLARDATLLAVGGGPAPPRRRVRFERLEDDDEGGLLAAVSEAAGRAAARRADRLLREQIEEHREAAFEGIVGISPQIRRIVERIRKAARHKLTVLISGETGTGKELIAEAIHRQSDRSRRPYKALNCAGLNENLLESELFGHVRGAYTGAISDRKGFFQASDGGTLFLDEVGDMPLTMQAKLLRALDRREIIPVGSTDVIHVDVRVIAATNRSLADLVEKKQFREDLYYRLNALKIEVPPLRDRRQDIPLLAHHMVQKANREHGTSVPGISSQAMSYLARYYWPGNVRELENVVIGVACEVGDRQIEVDDLPESIRGSRDIVPVSAGGLVGLTMEQVERMMIERTLQATGGNREQAAKMLNIGTRTLYRKIKEYGL